MKTWLEICGAATYGTSSRLSGWRRRVSQWHEEAVESGGSSSGVDSGHPGSSPSSHTHLAAPVPSSSICKWSLSPQPALILCGSKSWRERKEGLQVGDLRLEHHPLAVAVILGKSYPFSQRMFICLMYCSMVKNWCSITPTLKKLTS